VEALEAAVGEDPARSEAWFNLGLAQAERGSHSEAEAAFRRCLELEPRDDVAAPGGNLCAASCSRRSG
jgi:cytochrome c-type biogenesis protein CcmH/NrfG